MSVRCISVLLTALAAHAAVYAAQTQKEAAACGKRTDRGRSRVSFYAFTFTDVRFYIIMREESEEIVHGCYHLSIFICLVIYIVITLLPVILPIVAIIVIAFSILIWYAKRKVRRHMEEYENEWNQQQEEYTTGNNSNLDSDDVIDVEFTERDDE